MKHLIIPRPLYSCVLLAFLACPVFSQPYYIAPSGNDTNPGTLAQPFASLRRAQEAVRRSPGAVILRGGTYYLPRTLVFDAQDSGAKDNPIVYQAYQGERPVISGGVRLDALAWQPYRDGIVKAQVPDDLRTEEIFINGERQILARYPNFNPSAQYFDGFAADAISTNRALRWADPAGGYYHAMHPALWGDFTWRITGKDAQGKVTLQGGWQNNRGAAEHRTIRFVENLFEELDAPGEWFLDATTHTLYFYPPAGLDLSKATVEATRLRGLIEFRGSQEQPVRFLTLKGLTFRHAARTVMDTKEPLLRSDWTIYRGGAVLFEGAEDCALEDCFLDQVGGNAVFVNDYNRRVALRGIHIAKAGASGICFVGDPKAARNPLFHYDQVNRLEDLDRTPGPRTSNYPADCLVEDCLIYLTGRVEKQTAGVHIDLAQGITIRHCSIYDMPRAGINIGDGCWGGHVIEFCDVFDTVKETGDHGSFNSWGRDRYWRPNIAEVNAWVREAPELPQLDAVKPVVLRNNRWRCDHGWDIDLDDGSSFYIITDNLCLRGGIKNREGYGRVVENNVMVGSGFHPHVWFDQSGDIFRRNIVGQDYRPARMHRPPWGRDMDHNLLHQEGADPLPAVRLQKQSGRDEHSLVADAQFVDPANGDYRVKNGSPALKLGFVNFPMHNFGVRKAELKEIARTPVLPGQESAPEASGSRDATPRAWLGATVRNIADQGEMSAYGLPGMTGVLVLEVPSGSVLAKGGLQKGDVILSVNANKAAGVGALLSQAPALAPFQALALGIVRQQKEIVLEIMCDDPIPGTSKSSETSRPRLHWADVSRNGRPFSKDPAVIRLQDRYLLYYSMPPSTNKSLPPGWGIGIAQSQDLIEWKRVGELQPEQECDQKGLCAPDAIVLNGKVHLFYQTYGNGARDAICHAVSDDGLRFTRDPSNPVFRPSGAWTSGRAIDADVFPVGGRLLLWFATRDPAMEVQMLGVAGAALDSGFGRTAWKQLHDGPVLKPELPWEKKCIEAPSVMRRGDTLYVFYAGGYNNEPQQIGVATSRDGIAWKRLSNLPLLPNGAPGEWNVSESGHPGIFEDADGRTYLFFQGNNDKGHTWFLSAVEIGWDERGPFVNRASQKFPLSRSGQ